MVANFRQQLRPRLPDFEDRTPDELRGGSGPNAQSPAPPPTQTGLRDRRPKPPQARPRGRASSHRAAGLRLPIQPLSSAVPPGTSPVVRSRFDGVVIDALIHAWPCHAGKILVSGYKTTLVQAIKAVCDQIANARRPRQRSGYRPIASLVYLQLKCGSKPPIRAACAQRPAAGRDRRCANAKSCICIVAIHPHLRVVGPCGAKRPPREELWRILLTLRGAFS